MRDIKRCLAKLCVPKGNRLRNNAPCTDGFGPTPGLSVQIRLCLVPLQCYFYFQFLFIKASATRQTYEVFSPSFIFSDIGRFQPTPNSDSINRAIIFHDSMIALKIRIFLFFRLNFKNNNERFLLPYSLYDFRRKMITTPSLKFTGFVFCPAERNISEIRS